MEIVDVYVFNLCFHGLLCFSWMEPSARMIHARLSLIMLILAEIHKNGNGTYCWLKTN